MFIEHPNHAYDAKQLWLYMDAQSEFVASASWSERVHMNGPFDGPSNHKQTVKLVSAESEDLPEIREWCAEQIERGAEHASIHRTWVMTGEAVPERLLGKRENTFLEAIRAEQTPN